MNHPFTRRKLVVILTGILAVTPIGVVLARYGGALTRGTSDQTPADRSFSLVNPRATLDLPNSQYSDSRGRFDIPLPASTGPEVALPSDVLVSSFNSLQSLEYLGEVTGNRVFGAMKGDGGSGSSRVGPRRGSSSFATASKGMGGVGAWGGVSGTASGRSASSTATTRAPRVAAVAPARTPRSSGPSSGGSSSSGSSSSSTASGASTAAAATAPVFSSTPVAVGTTGSVSANGPGPAHAPEPMTLMLMGTGLAGLYRARRYFQ